MFVRGFYGKESEQMFISRTLGKFIFERVPKELMDFCEEIEDSMKSRCWTNEGELDMDKRIPDAVRQGIVDKIIIIGQIDGGIGSYKKFFERVYPECVTIPRNQTTLAAEIGRHCDSFPSDWGDENGMFAEVDILNWTDEQFLFFCNEYVNPVFNRYYWDADNGERINLQAQCVEAINYYLKDCGYELKKGAVYGDKAEYSVVEMGGVDGHIQGIVFAAVGKPDLVIADFLNHKIEIPIEEEKYLFYNQQVDIHGIKWSALREWYNNQKYSEIKNFEDRLWESVKHCGSPIEEKLFSSYLEIIGELGDDVPALLPQVYLYYDPLVQKERVEKIFNHQCMDFLMLISECKRIVIELDGVQHYAEDEKIICDGKIYPGHIASPKRYADMVSAQRDMTLAGYEVYRFGGSEFHDDRIAKDRIKKFFVDLFTKHKVI